MKLKGDYIIVAQYIYYSKSTINLCMLVQRIITSINTGLVLKVPCFLSSHFEQLLDLKQTYDT